MTPRRITIHCSALNNKFPHDIEDITEWHVARGWRTCGYHIVIPVSGVIQEGRPLDVEGAHVLGENDDNVGICICGNGPHDFTEAQGESLIHVVIMIMRKYNIAIADVRGHYEFDDRKKCPNLSMPLFRSSLRAILRWLPASDEKTS